MLPRYFNGKYKLLPLKNAGGDDKVIPNYNPRILIINKSQRIYKPRIRNQITSKLQEVKIVPVELSTNGRKALEIVETQNCPAQKNELSDRCVTLCY
jgi:hypothetical protein